jgi:hypothetical protein
LIAHLGGHAGLAGGLGDLARLEHGIGEGFFAIDVFAAVERGQGDDGVGVVGRGDHHGIDIFLGQQLAVIAVGLAGAILAGAPLPGVELVRPPARGFASAGAMLGALGPVPGEVTAAFAVDVTDGHDLHFGELRERGQVLHALAAQADAGEGGFGVRRDLAGPAEDVARHEVEGGRGGGELEKMAAGKAAAGGGGGEGLGRIVVVHGANCSSTGGRKASVVR